MKIILPTSLSRHAEGTRVVHSNAETLSDGLSDAAQQYPALSHRLFDDESKVSRNVNIFINGCHIGAEADAAFVSENDEVLLVTALAGG